MAELETLLALCQIAVAVAGFSAVVVVFKRGESGHWLVADADRFHGMLIHSMAGVFFCLLPPIVALFTADPSTVWAIASAVLGLQIVGHSAIIVRLPSTTRRTLSSLILAAGALALQVLNVCGIGFSREFGPYLAGILWHVVQAGVLFVGLVWVRDHERAAEPPQENP